MPVWSTFHMPGKWTGGSEYLAAGNMRKREPSAAVRAHSIDSRIRWHVQLTHAAQQPRWSRIGRRPAFNGGERYHATGGVSRRPPHPERDSPAHGSPPVDRGWSIGPRMVENILNAVAPVRMYPGAKRIIARPFAL